MVSLRGRCFDVITVIVGTKYAMLTTGSPLR